MGKAFCLCILINSVLSILILGLIPLGTGIIAHLLAMAVYLAITLVTDNYILNKFDKNLD